MFLVFGASAPATTAILTAIFLGIALGSRLATPFAARMTNPAKVYAGLELSIGIWAMLVPWALQVSEGLYVSAANWVTEQSPSLGMIRFALAVLPLLPATLAMGATVPVMIQTVSHAEASRVSWAYGMNVLGAMAGCLFAGFYALPHFGLSGTTWLAVGMNGLAFLLLMSLGRFPDGTLQSEITNSPTPLRRPRWLSPGYFLAGFVALGLEVVWLRFLGIVNTNSTATFTLTLMVYLLGMGLGSLAGYPLFRRWFSSGTVFLLANLGVALSALLTFRVLYDAVSIKHVSITPQAMAGTLTLFRLYQVEGLIIGLLLLLPTLFMGLVYPAVCDLGTSDGVPKGSWNAQAYFVGTLGSVAGILLVSMGMIPAWGLHGSFAVLVGCSVLVGFLTAWALFPKRRPVTVLLTAGVCFWIGTFSLNPQPVLRKTIAQKQGGVWMEFDPSGNPAPLSELVYIKAGKTGTVMIKKAPEESNQFLYVDDQLVASTNLGAKVDAYMLAHLPLLLHADPKSALTVGFGSGGTSHAMTTHGVETYCVEIEEAVPNAASLLTDQNYGVINNPHFHLLINDARDHLHITDKRYDVISTDVTNLSYKQNSSLYTVEYFQLMKDRLNEGGIACAWIPMAAVTTEELQTLMHSFQQVFEHATLWFMNHTHTNFGILIGTPGLLKMDFARFQAGFADPQIAESLGQIGMTDPLQLVHSLHLDEAGYRAFCGHSLLHTDDQPVLEFSSPLSFYKYHETFRDNLQATLKHRPENIRGYVDHFPQELDEAWEKHRIASASFCQVVLEAYNFIVEGGRGNRKAALDAFERAAVFAKQGLEALPEDVEREKYYDEFAAQAYDLATQGQR